MKALLSDGMYMMPLSFVYTDDKRADEIEDQLLVGESVMIAPVYIQNATGRNVYLPEDMKLVRFRSFDDYDEEVLAAGDHYIECALNETIIFVRKGHVLPICTPAKSVGELDYSTIRYICFDAEAVDYELYNDDGTSAIK
jgi:alpha-glucosidase